MATGLNNVNAELQSQKDTDAAVAAAPTAGNPSKHEVGEEWKEKKGVGLSSKKRSTLLAASGAAGASGAVDNQFFFEDEIFRVDKKGRVKFGLVIETCETYSGDEDDDFEDVLVKGEVRVAWSPEGREEVHREGTIALADRTLMPGDVVRRMVPGRDTQRGYCREINMRADVKVLGTKYVIKNVMAERLQLINTWQRDSAVCLDSWVGSTKDVEDKAILISNSGARVEIPSNAFFAFKDLNSRYGRGLFDPQIFYPGNVVVGRLPNLEYVKLLTPNIPLHTNKKGKPLMGKFTVESVYTDSVWVHWQCRALSEDSSVQTSLLQQPNPYVRDGDLKRLKRLNLFESCMLQLSDRTRLKYSKCDTVIRKSQWDKEQAIKFKLLLSQQQRDGTKYQITHSNTTSSTSTTTNSSLNFEKVKKKLSQHDSDKSTNKSKKFAMRLDKFEKLNVSGSKEKSPGIQESNNDATESNIHYKTKKHNNSPEAADSSGWITDNDDENDEDEDFDYCSDDFKPEGGASTTTTISTCSSPSPHNSPINIKRRLLRKKGTTHLKKSSSTSLAAPEFVPKHGDELVTEALLVYSTATVVWQDGSVESGIPSTQLYPIHHLDNHEFFPGDFIVSGKEDTDVSTFRDYGVVQTVDHHGRTANVKWFTTYTSSDEPKPTYKGESEVSVYDLKDHPDFQYRPGTMVIRVANFVGEDANCTAGQIIDNFIDGRVKVWWVDGHISMCWPQDLFEVGQFDHTDWGHDSDDSWETESENSEYGGGASPKLSIEESHVLSNIERARVAIARLEEIFNMSPNLQNLEVMRKLLNVFKGCRYLDRLLNTSFFHEDNFMGLIERVRKGGNQTISERAQDRKNRLFSYAAATPQSPPSPNSKPPFPQYQQPPQQPQPQHQQCHHYQAIVAVNSAQKLQNSLSNTNTSVSKEYAPKVIFNISSTPFKCSTSYALIGNSSGGGGGSSGVGGSSGSPSFGSQKRKFSPIATSRNEHSSSSTNIISENVGSVAVNNLNNSALSRPEVVIQKHNPYNAEKNQLLNSAMLNIEKTIEKTSQLKSSTVASTGTDDSGNYSRNEYCDGSSASYASSSDLTNVDANGSLMKVNDDQKSISCSSIEITEDATPEYVCVRLCALLKEQLVKCLNEIREKYYKEDHLSLAEVFGDIEEETLETVLNINAMNSEEDKTDEKTLTTTSSPPPLAFDRAVAKQAESTPDTGDVTDANVGDTPFVNVDMAPSQNSSSPTLTTSNRPSSPKRSLSSLVEPTEYFQVLPTAPKSHKFHLTIFHPNNPKQYYRAVQREHRMLKNSLPPGVWVRVFEDRMDLLSVMIEGPKKTPYEDGMFLFDIQLGREYPKSPPLCHYISYCSDRLNPNLYEDGKVCVSLLGTWSGRDSEIWGPSSTLLQVIVSIQGLILVPEPYFNEAGYEKQRGTQQGRENSRMYNEMVMIKMVQAMTKLLQQPPILFSDEIVEHFKQRGQTMYVRIKGWMELSKPTPKVQEAAVQDCCETMPVSDSAYMVPDFPLVPASRGFCLTLAGLLEAFKLKLNAKLNISSSETSLVDIHTLSVAAFQEEEEEEDVAVSPVVTTPRVQ